MNARVTECRRCDRLVAWREQVARERRAAFRDHEYWGRPVPGFGDPAARVVVVGLAPAAHGANRTGRMFTGDRSGDFLYASLHRCGFANQPESESPGDGLTLNDVYVTAAVRCAPPANKPTVEERDACAGYLVEELALLRSGRVVVVLGAFAYGVMCSLLGVRPRPRFGHGVAVGLAAAGSAGASADPTGLTHLLCSFHPSQQNTFTGRLTEPMLDDVFVAARRLAESADG
ncbi:MAG TPA: uracil-DNA glycosylase [Acidimicrobiaceae bacterium]|nr:uracil-DNA glycosylase [Acidimicrobiaceae bacterium]